MEALGDAQSILLTLLLRLGAAILILIAGRWLARRACRWAYPLIAKTTLTDSLKELAVKALYFGILFAAFLFALTVLGVPTTSVVTSVGIVAVILGIALQESIGNFAATVIFLLFEPFEVGDVIETGGVSGKVVEIQLFSTVIHKGNQTVAVLPNSRIQSDGVVNFSKLPELRIDLEIGIGYDDDIAKARAVALDILQQDPRVLKDPVPQIVVLGLDDSSVKLGIRPFVKGEEYWPVFWDMTERLKTGFDAAGISMPFPQRDIHMIAPADQEQHEK